MGVTECKRLLQQIGYWKGYTQTIFYIFQLEVQGVNYTDFHRF